MWGNDVVVIFEGFWKMVENILKNEKLFLNYFILVTEILIILERNFKEILKYF